MRVAKNLARLGLLMIVTSGLGACSHMKAMHSGGADDAYSEITAMIKADQACPCTLTCDVHDWYGVETPTPQEALEAAKAHDAAYHSGVPGHVHVSCNTGAAPMDESAKPAESDSTPAQ